MIWKKKNTHTRKQVWEEFFDQKAWMEFSVGIMRSLRITFIHQKTSRRFVQEQLRLSDLEPKQKPS